MNKDEKRAMRYGKGVEEKGLWSELGVDLLESIIRQLSFVERLIFRAVCISWSFMNITSPPNQMPMLMVFDDKKGKSCKLVDPMSKKAYIVNMKSLKKRKTIKYVEDMRVYESKFGWLLISSQYDKNMFSISKPLFLYTPFSNDHNNFIKLPTSNLSESFVFATFSSDPLSADCLFLTVDVYPYDRDKGGARLGIRTCRRGDKSWSKRIIKGLPIDQRCYDSNTFLYSKGILYFASNAGILWSLDISQDRWVVLPPPPDVMGLQGFFGEIHMVKLDDELLVITGIKDSVVNNRCTFHGTFLRLDLSLMTWKWDLVREEDCLLTYFIGSGYNSILKFSEQRRYYGSFLHSLIMSYLSQPSLELYGSIAAQPYRKLWIDPVVITSRGNSSRPAAAAPDLFPKPVFMG